MADGEDDLIESLGGTEMDSIYTGPADDLGKNRSAKIVALPFSAYETNMRKIQLGSEITV